MRIRLFAWKRFLVAGATLLATALALVPIAISQLGSPAKAQSGLNQLVSIFCTGTVLVTRSPEQPTSRATLQTANVACTSLSHPAITTVTGNGVAEFTGECGLVQGSYTMVVSWPDTAATSTVQGTFTGVRTAGGGLEATVNGSSVTAGRFAGATGLAMTTTVQGIDIECITSMSPNSMDSQGTGTLAGI